ncbi:MAG: hypothetical protein K6G07_03345 [Lachnospiraceae bacterium]|nr:hypothetical protein [Lachnospiraceae bacterium]
MKHHYFNTVSVNREIKDRVFVAIFGREEHKSWILELYNAINHSSYEDPDAITITTIEHHVYMGMKNDVSFLLNSIMSLYEHQSSYNPNMPVRELMYSGRLYDKYIKTNDLNVYGSRLMELPVPKLLVFYNGTKDEPDETILNLSDSFLHAPEGIEPDISVRVRMLNVNYGHNRELLKACKPLEEYAWFVARIRSEMQKREDMEAAVDAAIDEMPEEYLIKPFLIANKAEVKGMCLTEYDEERVMRQFQRDAFEEGAASRQAEIDAINQTIADNKRTIADKEQIIADKEQAIADKEQAIADNKRTIADKEQTIADQEQAIADKEQIIADKEQIIAAYEAKYGKLTDGEA